MLHGLQRGTVIFIAVTLTVTRNKQFSIDSTTRGSVEADLCILPVAVTLSPSNYVKSSGLYKAWGHRTIYTGKRGGIVGLWGCGISYAPHWETVDRRDIVRSTL